MSTKYLIFQDRHFAHRENKPDGYVCYRTIICHALLKKIQRSSVEEAKLEFLKFRGAFENGSEFHSLDFVSFYPVQMSQNTGFLLVDKSQGYYPLVIYPSPKVSGASRRSAFKSVLDDLHDNIDELLKRLVARNEWNSDLQLELQSSVFHYSEDEGGLSEAA